MLACVPLIAPASPAGGGPRAASSSRPSRASSGRSPDGPHHRSPSSSRPPPTREIPPRAQSPPMAAAARRTRTSPSLSRAIPTATATASPAATSRCGASPASRPAHPHPCLLLQAPSGCELSLVRSAPPSRLRDGTTGGICYHCDRGHLDSIKQRMERDLVTTTLTLVWTGSRDTAHPPFTTQHAAGWFAD